MAFTLREIENIANAVLDRHMARGTVKSQTLQDKPLLDKLMSKKKSFPNGKENLIVNVKGQYTSTLEGFSHDDTVAYSNPANIRQAYYPYKLMHIGISFSYDELIKDGIQVSDTATGESTSRKSDTEMQSLAKLMDDKFEDLLEGRRRGLNNMLWRDGAQDSSLVPGLTSFIVNDPTTATVVAGIDQSANTWWRNRANLSLNATAANASTQVLLTEMQSEMRQLTRYGGKPNIILAGSDFIEQMENELRAKGNYTMTGWSDKTLDGSVGELTFKGVPVVYDPTLDDLSKAKYAYILDMNTINVMEVAGEGMKKHAPARPEDKYVFYRAITDVMGLVCNQRNANGVMSIA